MDCDFLCLPSCESLLDPEFSACAPKTYFGPISNIYLSGIGHSFLDIDDANEWAYRLAITGSNASKIIDLKITGEKPAAKDNEVTGAYGKIAYSNKIHILNFTISQANDANYDMMRYFERHRTGLGWYKTNSGKMYGGNCGIEMQISLNDIIPVNSGEIETLTGTITFITKHHPQRTDSVI